MAGEGNDNEGNNKATWNELQKAYLVELLVQFNRPGTRQQNAWSSVAWTEMTRKFKAKFADSNFTVKQLKEQERSLKRQYKTVKQLRDQSGFGWDSARKMVDAPEEVWAPILQTNKDAKRGYNRSFPYYDDLDELHSGCIANGSRRRGSNQYASFVDNFETDSPSPTMPAPGGNNQCEFDNDFFSTQAFDPVSIEAQVPSSSQVPTSPQVPVTPAIPSSEPKKTRKRKKMSEFHEKYLEYKREETRIYSAAMEKNANKACEREEKYSIAAAMDAYQKLPDFDIVTFVQASDLFLTVPEIREAFLSIIEAHRSEWIKMMIELYKSKKKDDV